MEKKGIENSVQPFFDKLEALSKTQRYLICGTVFLLIAGAFVYFLYWPNVEKKRRLKSQLKTMEKKLVRAKKNAADLETFQKRMDEARAQFKMAMQKLPNKEEIPSLLTAISNAGQQVGLEFLLFQPKSERKREFYAEIPVAINVKGDYHNLASFFDQVARLSRIVNIKNIQMSRGKGKGGKNLNAKCTAVTYKFIDKPPKKKNKKKKKKKKRR